MPHIPTAGIHSAAIANGVLTGLSVVATLILAVVALRALRTSNRQAEEASHAVEEGRRARVDGRAPAVFVEVDEPMWPPVEPSVIGGTPNAIDAAQAYTVPSQDELRLFLRFECRLTNYGAIPASVRIDGPVEPTADSSGRGYHMLPREGGCRFVLAPGSQRRYILVFEQTIGEWRQEPAPEGVSVFRRIVVSDQFADGVLDSTLVTLQAKPLEADPNNGGRFTIRTNKVAGGAASLYGHAQVSPTERMYRRMEAPPTEPAPRWWHRIVGP